MGENYITCREEKGSINISEDVIISMVRSVLSEVEGVAGLSNTAGAELAELIGLKSVSKGVKVQFGRACSRRHYHYGCVRLQHRKRGKSRAGQDPLRRSGDDRH